MQALVAGQGVVGGVHLDFAVLAVVPCGGPVGLEDGSVVGNFVGLDDDGSFGDPVGLEDGGVLEGFSVGAGTGLG